METGFHLEDDFFNFLSNHIDRKGISYKYSIVRDPRLSDYTSSRLPFHWNPDLLVLKGLYPFMIIEVTAPRKFSSDAYVNRFLATNFSIDLEIIGADYLILTDTVNFILFDRRSPNPVVLPIENIFNLFSDTISSDELIGLKSSIVQIFRSTLQESTLVQSSLTPNVLNIETFLQNFLSIDSFSYDVEGRFFHFATNAENGLEDPEHQFFQALLRPVLEEAVCRYTTLDTLFHTVNSNSFRMASHIAMNDRGEVDYVDKYIGIYYKPLQMLSLGEVKQLNRNYISSCTTIDKEDDLTMYRLYGDDSKGVCLRFSVANGAQSSNLIVKKISYATNRNSHPELDFIKSIISGIGNSLGVRFRFLYLDIWKHFFKSSDYAVEQEVRVLYIANSNTSTLPISEGWVIAQPDRILSKYITFDLAGSTFPLSLQRVILGPNCPERDVNRRQLEVLLDEKKLTTISVSNSQIESYRKP